MTIALPLNPRANRFLLLALMWSLLFVLPWTRWLDSLPWIRMALAILIFLVPGLAFSLFLAGDKLTLPAHVPSGLALSLFLVGSLGVTGRVLNLPFDSIKPVFAMAGLLSLLFLHRAAGSGRELFRPHRYKITTILLFLMMLGLSIFTSLQDRFVGDDLSYLAYLTNWQHADPLNFADVIFGMESIGPVRYWLAMLPMNFGFLAELSNLHGLLVLGLYLQPFIIALPLLAAYNLYEDLLQSESQAIVAVFLQIAFLYLLFGHLQVGRAFFLRLTEDKSFSSFILTPVFLLAVRLFVRSFNWRTGILVLLSGWSLGLIHPIILAYAIFIAGLSVLMSLMTAGAYKKLAIVVALLVMIILPPSSLRFVRASGPRGVFDLGSAQLTGGINERITYVEGTPFYGFNLERVRIASLPTVRNNPVTGFLSWSYLWVLGVGFLWALFNLKKKESAAYIAAASLLVMVSAFPYTGWLVGYLVSARMLWRVPWLLPVGLIFLVLTEALERFLSIKIPVRITRKISSEGLLLSLMSVLCFIVVGYSFMPIYRATVTALGQAGTYHNNLEKLSNLGNYLENNIEQASVFLAPGELMDYLPGLSSKSDVVFFRAPNFTPFKVDLTAINRIFALDPDVSLERRTGILEKYNVGYILADDTAIRDLYAGYPEHFMVRNFDGFWIIEYLDNQQ